MVPQTAQTPESAVPGALHAAIAGLLALAVGMGIGRFAFTPVLPVMQADAGVSLVFAGWLAAANYVGYLAGALAAIRIRASPAVMVRVSLLATAASTALMGLTDWPPAWLVLRAVAGVVSAWVLIFAAAWVLPVLAARRREGLGGVLFGGVGFGTALTGVLCLVFLHLAWTSAQVWLALGATAAVLSAISWRAFAPSGAARAAPAAAAAARPRPAPPPRTWPLVLGYGCFGFGYIIPATFLPAMARDAVPDPAVFGWAWPLFGAAALASTLFVGTLHRVVSNRTIWVAGQVVMALAVAVPVAWPGIGGITASSLGVGGSLMVVTLASLKEARRLAPHAASSLMATMTAAFATGQAVGPMLVSAAAGAGRGLDALLLLASAVLLASVLPLALGGRPAPGAGE